LGWHLCRPNIIKRNLKNVKTDKLYIKSIQLRNFKNHTHTDFTFSPLGALVVGKNGIGKTNLLEAISYSNFGKSIINHPDKDLMSFSADHFFIKAVYSINDTDSEIKVFFQKDKKVISVGEKHLQKLSDLMHLVQIIYSSPDDIYHIFSSPQKRCLFIDMAISKVYPVYIDIYKRFKVALTQRNALLKTDYSPAVKEAWDTTFAYEANNVAQYRLKFITEYMHYLKNAYQMIVKNTENIDIALKQSFSAGDDYVNKMMAKLNEYADREKRYQCSLIGPHRDDLLLSVNSKNAIYYASQGQKRSIVIALKIALAQMIQCTYNQNPILIFDDTLAELDTDRSLSLIANLAPHHQIFIASPQADKYLSTRLPVMELNP